MHEGDSREWEVRRAAAWLEAAGWASAPSSLSARGDTRGGSEQELVVPVRMWLVTASPSSRQSCSGQTGDAL